ncbi:Xre family transcriptional regulator [Chromohalobacter marismortui]|uniref:Xre family transcriptional regulator n=1 Tax=Chromohalobacter marismortui TaxID=42055 RepID=A0A4R7NG25_9GAMM|nr:MULTISPECIES: RodZ domain-containing protein [Chromohalobacter]MCI0509386.1 DUF4115 domain-containing protein [Chromohalobacter sp.]MCI0593007.1 DUF4115 domain-containing protein [Chromohalobacter sp.]TDU19258.1 Xre family transcriptional regulator [Chromohalobacter marismortui]
MSDTHEQHVSPSPSEGHEPPGTRLRRERERQGLSLEEVAEQLNLRPAVVTGLEEDRFDQVPIATYRRGYLRAYAKLLGVDDKLVAQDYDALHGRDDLDRKVAPPAYRSQPPSRIGAWLFKLVTLLIIVGLIGLTLLWWQSREGNDLFGLGDKPAASMDSIDNGGGSTEGSAQAASMADDASSGDSVSTQRSSRSDAASGVDAQDSLPSVPDESDDLGLVDNDAARIDEVPTTTTDTSASNESVTSTAQGNATSTDSAAASTSANDDTATQDDEANTAAANANQLTLTFNEQSWTEIYDADDQRLMVGLQDPGTSTELQGTPPFRLTIGNASGVDLRYQGESVDLSQYTGGNNVARFTLGE